MAEDGNWNGHTILVVEDAEAVRKLVCAMLSASGYECLEACDGDEALQLVEAGRHSFNLVLTDVVMPKMGGIEFARALNRIRPGMRIVFMSGYTDRPLVDKVVFLSKPFTAAALLDTVRQSLDGE